MPRILASSAYSFQQPLPSLLWSPSSCILESVLGPRGSSSFFFSWLFFSSFSCVSSHLSSFSYCSCSSSYLLLSFSPSFVPPPVISLPSPAFLLAPPICSLAPPVAFCPPITCLFLLSLFCLLLLLFCCLLSFPFSLPVVSSCLCSSVASRLRSTVASCPFFLSSLPVISFRPSPPGRRQLSSPVLSFLSSPSLLLSYPWCLPPPSSLLFFCFFSCSSCLLFVVYDFYF